MFLSIKEGTNSRDASAIPVPGPERNASLSGSQEETLKLGKELPSFGELSGLYLKASYKSKSIPKPKVYNQRFIYKKKKKSSTDRAPPLLQELPPRCMRHKLAAFLLATSRGASHIHRVPDTYQVFCGSVCF